MIALFSRSAAQVFALSSTGEGIVSGGADGYVKVRVVSRCIVTMGCTMVGNVLFILLWIVLI